jgi:F1F0 ATPase subunit 2
MAMSDALTLVLAWAAGMGLGALFFGGLWWTVQRAVSSSQPALWLAGSLLLRTGVVLAGLYRVSGGHWERIVACLAGVVMARVVVMRVTRPYAQHGIGRVPEANRAP